MFELEHFPWKIGTISMRRTPQQALSFITASGTSWFTSASKFAVLEEVVGNGLGSRGFSDAGIRVKKEKVARDEGNCQDHNQRVRPPGGPTVGLR